MKNLHMASQQEEMRMVRTNDLKEIIEKIETDLQKIEEAKRI